FLTRRTGDGRPDTAIELFLPRPPRKTSAPLLQFRWRRAVEHVALWSLQHIKGVGFNHKRPALARNLADPLDAGEVVLQRVIAGEVLANIEQFSRKLRRIRFG